MGNDSCSIMDGNRKFFGILQVSLITCTVSHCSTLCCRVIVESGRLQNFQVYCQRAQSGSLGHSAFFITNGLLFYSVDITQTEKHTTLNNRFRAGHKFRLRTEITSITLLTPYIQEGRYCHSSYLESNTVSEILGSLSPDTGVSLVPLNEI